MPQQDLANIERIIEEVTREVLLRLNAPAAAGDERQCAHGKDASQVCTTCVNTMAAAGADRISGKIGMAQPDHSVARRIDHTMLKADASQAQIAQLCYEARTYHFASVCVNPTNVKLCAQLLKDSDVAVCTVVGFPLGATPATVKAFETQQGIRDGATEIDMVINIGALKSQDYRTVFEDIATVVRAAHAGRAIVKVIIEAALLTDDEKVVASQLTKAGGADFVKTSTGFGPGGATAEDVALLRRVVGPGLGVKAAGGVRTLADAEAMIAAGATRLGASAGVKIVGGQSTAAVSQSGY